MLRLPYQPRNQESDRMNRAKKFQGCLAGLALGDACCAEMEGGVLERLLWKIIGRTNEGKKRYTDDTRMMLDLGNHIVNHGGIDQDSLALDFARSYRWSRGYGPSTAHVLKRIRQGMNWKRAATYKYPDGSYGNGAAMRVPVVSLAFATIPEIVDAVRKSSEVTHPNPAAIAGAKLIALSVYFALNDIDILNQKEHFAKHLDHEMIMQKTETVFQLLHDHIVLSPGEVQRILGFGTSATDSCPTALYLSLAFHHDECEKLIKYVNRCKGDTDTIGAMACSVWGAMHGYDMLPATLLHELEGHDEILELANRLYQRPV